MPTPSSIEPSKEKREGERQGSAFTFLPFFAQASAHFSTHSKRGERQKRKTGGAEGHWRGWKRRRRIPVLLQCHAMPETKIAGKIISEVRKKYFLFIELLEKCKMIASIVEITSTKNRK